MPEIAWVLLAVLPVALLARVIFFASTAEPGGRTGGRAGQKGVRASGAQPGPRPDEKRTDDSAR